MHLIKIGLLRASIQATRPAFLSLIWIRWRIKGLPAIKGVMGMAGLNITAARSCIEELGHYINYKRKEGR